MAHSLKPDRRFDPAHKLVKLREANIMRMAEPYPFAMIVESHPIFANRYRWKISKAGVVAEISDESQATAEEARAAGERAMKALLEKWKPEK